MNLLIRQTPHGKRVRPLADDERDRMLGAATARHLKGRIYVEVPPAAVPVVSRRAASYETKVMLPGLDEAKADKPKSNRKVT